MAQPSNIETTAGRLHVVPRYRQKLAFVPLGQGRPRWIDDPHLNLRYHIRRTALPRPGTEAQLRALAGRVFSQPLDRDKQITGIEVALGEWLGDKQIQRDRHDDIEPDLLPDQHAKILDRKPRNRPPPKFVDGRHEPGGPGRRLAPRLAFDLLDRPLLQLPHLSPVLRPRPT